MHICNFCGKKQDEVFRMIASNDVDICSDCVAACLEILVKDIKGNMAIDFNTKEQINESESD
jgi:ATP-dependent protease Clp ATPase subunit